jgi:hypothetical protein
MPANLPPDYHAAEKRFRAARTSAEKIEALEEMLRIMPKHKGTDRLQGDLKARIAKLRREPEKKGAKRGFGYAVHREGAGQIALVGPPNTGKSSLVRMLTKARPDVADYPFTTREPVPGMMPFEDIAFQLVDLPAVSEEHVEHWVFDIVRQADMVWIVVDSSEPFGQMEQARRLLEERRIGLYPAGADPPKDERLDYKHKKAVVVVTGMDRPGAGETVEVLEAILEKRWPLMPVSCVTGRGLEDLRLRTFSDMGIMRVYTKQPGRPPDMGQPFTLMRGASVADLAERIHKEVREKLRFARIWGKSAFDGQTVQRDHVLSEGDVVEIHA